MASGNGDLQVVISIDTTGGMCSVVDIFKYRVSQIIDRVLGDIPDLQIAVIAHGDYCDNPLYWYLDFTSSASELCDFVQNIKLTNGGDDDDECYEYILHEIRNGLSWKPTSRKAVIMVGHCNPHAPDYHLNFQKLDWRKEADDLSELGVRIYTVQYKNYGERDIREFYSELAKRTLGCHIHLEDFENFPHIILTVCYKENGPDSFADYEKEVLAAKCRFRPLHKDLKILFGRLKAQYSSRPFRLSAKFNDRTKIVE